ncbi:MAG: alpha/beta hydrolase, partial [Aeromicrobium sp.]
TDERRLDVPATIICCEFPSQVLRDAIQAEEPWVAEVARLRHVEYVDLPTGHWPQFTKPVELGRLIVEALDRH